jgi:hypothetical protein
VQLLVEQLDRRARIYAARRSLLKLFSESMPVRMEILDRLTVLQAQIAIHNQLQCFSHNEIRRSKYPPTKMGQRIYCSALLRPGQHHLITF